MKDRIVNWVALNGPSLGALALIIVCLVLLTGCNTIAGMGTDIQRSATWTAEKMSGSKTDQPAKAN